MSSDQNYPRLGVKYDPSGLQQAKTDAQRATEALRQVGRTTSEVGVGLQQVEQSSTRATQAFNRVQQAADGTGRAYANVAQAAQQTAREQASATRQSSSFADALLKEGRALAGKNATLEQMARALSSYTNAQGQVVTKTSAYFDSLRQLRTAMDAQNQNQERATGGLNLMQAAVGGLAAAVGFQLVNALAAAGRELAELPYKTAKAADAFKMLQARLTFSFGGNRSEARGAYGDILDIARITGAPLPGISGAYSQTAIAGQGIGLNRQQTTNTTRAFQMLALEFGASSQEALGAAYQFQQALSYGRLNSQDFRFMSQNMPGIKSALADGLGVNQAEMMRMMRAGEIDARDMISAMEKALPKIKQDFARLVPETMERAHGQMTVEWTKLMQDLGQKFQTSAFFQDIQKGIGYWLRQADVAIGGDGPGAKASQIENFYKNIDAAGLGKFVMPGKRREVEKQIADLRAQEANQGRFTSMQDAVASGAGLTSSADPNFASRRSLLDEVLGYQADLAPNRAERGQIQKRLTRAREALANGGSASEMADVQNVISLLSSKLATLGSAFERATMQISNSAADLDHYGPGANFDMASQARQMIEQSASQGEQLGMGSAMQSIFRRRLIAARNTTGSNVLDFDLRRRFSTAGLDPVAARAAGVDLQTAQFAVQFGKYADTPEAKAAISDQRALYQKQSDSEVADTIANRRRDQQQTLKDVQEEMSIRRKLGTEGTVQMAQFRAMQELKRQGLTVDKEAVAAEMARTEQLVRATEELDKQNQAFARLQQAADAAGEGVRATFYSAIHEAFEKGSISAKNVMQGIANTAEQISVRIFDKLIIDKAADRATDFFENLLNNLFGGGGGGTGGASGGGGGSANHAFGGEIGGARPFGLGGVSQTPTLFSMANGMGLAFEAGAEAVLPLQRGPDGRLGVASLGGGADSGTVVNIHDHRTSSSAEAVETQSSRGPDGKRMIDIYVRDRVNSGIRKGEFDTSMNAQYGAARTIKRI